MSSENKVLSIFSLEQMSKTGNLDADLILIQYIIDLLSRFKEIKSINPKLTQKQKTTELRYSDSPRNTTI